jgi:hypothetical protein
VVQEHYSYTRDKESMRKKKGDKESMNKKKTKIV